MMAQIDPNREQSKQLAKKTQSALVSQLVKERDKLISRPQAADPNAGKKGDFVDEVFEDFVKATAASIGFFSEISHHRKEKKIRKATSASAAQPEQAPLADEGEAQAVPTNELTPKRSASSEVTDEASEKKKPDDKKTVAAFLQRHPLTAELPLSTDRLTLPVVIGQRRPEDRTRGFMRAYAPALEDVGISQDVFLDFLDTFNKVLEPSPWIQTINLADLVGTIVPEPALMAVGYVTDLIVDMASEAQSRFASNKFLDRVNAEFFVPRGLFCLVTTWKPEEAHSEDETDDGLEGKPEESSHDFMANFNDYNERRSKPGFAETAKDAFSREIPPSEILPRLQDRLKEMIRPSTMQYGWIESAPLIFPSHDDTDTIADANGENQRKKKGALTRAGDWTDEHMDKHARAQWLAEHRDAPGAQLMPTSEFKSRYADPAHPAASGDWVALVTGGRWQSKKGPVSGHRARSRSRERKEKRRKEKRRKEEEKKHEKGKQGTISASDIVTSLLRKDVYYLVVVDISNQTDQKPAEDAKSESGEQVFELP